MNFARYKNITSRIYGFHITVDPPVITPMPDQTVVENNTVYFTCKLTSQPSVTEITWWLNETIQFTNGSGTTISEPLTTHPDAYSVVTTSVLTVTDAQRVTDAGEITCRGRNAIGTTEEKAKLIVHCKNEAFIWIYRTAFLF